VYAAGSEQSGFGTGACSRTRRLSHSQTDLVLLRELKSGRVRPRIFGRVMGLLIPPRPDRTSAYEQSFAMPNVIVSVGIYTRSSRERWERAFCTAMHHKPAPIDALITFVTELLAHVERTAPTYVSNARLDRTTHPIPFFGDVLTAEALR
jgi:hypothetical protein